MKLIYYPNGVGIQSDNTRVTVAKAAVGGELADGQYVYLYFTRIADAGLESDEPNDGDTVYRWNREKTRGTRTHRLLINAKRLTSLEAAIQIYKQKFLNQ